MALQELSRGKVLGNCQCVLKGTVGFLCFPRSLSSDAIRRAVRSVSCSRHTVSWADVSHRPWSSEIDRPNEMFLFLTSCLVGSPQTQCAFPELMALFSVLGGMRCGANSRSQAHDHGVLENEGRRLRFTSTVALLTEHSKSLTRQTKLTGCLPHSGCFPG